MIECSSTSLEADVTGSAVVGSRGKVFSIIHQYLSFDVPILFFGFIFFQTGKKSFLWGKIS